MRTNEPKYMYLCFNLSKIIRCRKKSNKSHGMVTIFKKSAFLMGISIILSINFRWKAIQSTLAGNLMKGWKKDKSNSKFINCGWAKFCVLWWELKNKISLCITPLIWFNLFGNFTVYFKSKSKLHVCQSKSTTLIKKGLMFLPTSGVYLSHRLYTGVTIFL